MTTYLKKTKKNHQTHATKVIEVIIIHYFAHAVKNNTVKYNAMGYNDTIHQYSQYLSIL